PAILPPRAAGGESKIVFIENFAYTGRVAGGEIFCFCLSRASSVSVFFFKTPTQNLKMQHFAQT
ncbi:MAG: hypothetical protein IKY29_04400, partial [Clostridia bacterium]|nr:hypothetical protein [Clostridia bacterium]